MPNTVPEGRDNYLHVVAAVIVRQGRILIARRAAERHQGGLWEFPGGKVEPGESAREALARELAEEVGISVQQARPLIGVRHRYPDRDVFLDVWRVEAFAGEAHGREGQPVRWVEPAHLTDYAFPAANRPIVRAAQLPPRYLITPEPGPPPRWPRFLGHLQALLAGGDIGLVQLRAPELSPAEYERLAGQVLETTRSAGARLVLNADPALAVRLGADGVHLNGARLRALSERPLSGNYWLGASCHGRDELRQAERVDCDYALLSPVYRTASHPEAAPLGWSRFAELVNDSRVPVYALGGVGQDDLDRAWQHGGQGVAAIRGFWETGQ